MPDPIFYLTFDGEMNWLCATYNNEFNRWPISMKAAARLNHDLAEFMAKNIRHAYIPRHDTCAGPLPINDNAHDYGLASNPEE